MPPMPTNRALRQRGSTSAANLPMWADLSQSPRRPVSVCAICAITSADKSQESRLKASTATAAARQLEGPSPKIPKWALTFRSSRRKAESVALHVLQGVRGARPPRTRIRARQASRYAGSSASPAYTKRPSSPRPLPDASPQSAGLHDVPLRRAEVHGGPVRAQHRHGPAIVAGRPRRPPPPLGPLRVASRAGQGEAPVRRRGWGVGGTSYEAEPADRGPPSRGEPGQHHARAQARGRLGPRGASSRPLLRSTAAAWHSMCCLRWLCIVLCLL